MTLETSSRLGLYGVWKYDGSPFLLPDGSIDQQAISNHARFGTIIVEAWSALLRPDIVASLRAANSDLRLIGFLNLEQIYTNPWKYPPDDLRNELFSTVANIPDKRGFVWSKKYGDWFDPEKLSMRPAIGRWSNYNFNLCSYEAVDALAEVVIRRVVTSGVFDGVFFDLAQQSIIWASSPNRDEIDYQQAGAVSLVDFDAGYREGHRQFFRRLHDAAPDGFSIGFNCSTTDPIESAWVNGQMDEGFPSNPGGGHDWTKVMQGIWAREKRRPDSENWINMPYSGPEALGFGLGSAYLTDSARFTCSGNNGRPDPDGREKIWDERYELNLGAARGGAMKAGTVWFREFENGVVVVDPNMQQARFYVPR